MRVRRALAKLHIGWWWVGKCALWGLFAYASLLAFLWEMLRMFAEFFLAVHDDMKPTIESHAESS